MITRVVPLCVVFLLVAAFAPAQDAKKELEALQGEWTMVSLEQNGKKAEESATQFKLTIKGDQWIVKSAASNVDGKITTTFKIDPSKNPKTIDLTPKIEDMELPTSQGIYKLDGDVLTMCRALGKGDRPTEFKGEASILVVWKRANKAK